MADNIVSGLFGIDPAQLQQQRMAQDLKEGYMLANLSPMERATAGIYAGSKQFGRAAQGLLGMEDPQLQEAAMAKKISEKFDVNSVEGLRGLAAELQRAGSLRYSQLAAQQANQLEAASLTRQKTQGDIGAAQRKLAQEEQLRAELSKATTNEERIAIASRYGNPDTILRTLQASEDRQAALEQRKATAGLAAATREETRSAKQMAADEKRQEKLDKQEQSANAAIMGADRIIKEVGEARDKVSGFTAGLGSYLSVLPLTEAKDLSKRLTTIKANLGFDRLQQMRDASPTGGALGQVAVQELIALQSTIASLDQDQSPAQLKQALDKIETSYANWRNIVRQAGKATVGGQPAGGSNEIDFNSLPKRK